MARSRYKTIENGKTYFATSTVVNWLPLFALPDLAHIVLDAMRFLHSQKRITLHGYVLMENHFHLIGSSSDFSGEMRKLKSFTARKIVDSLKERGQKSYLEQLAFFKKRHKNDQTFQVWQEGFHPQLIQNGKMMTQKLEYTHHNPVRRGYVDYPEQWRYSSCRQYLGAKGLVPIVSLV